MDNAQQEPKLHRFFNNVFAARQIVLGQQEGDAGRDEVTTWSPPAPCTQNAPAHSTCPLAAVRTASRQNGLLLRVFRSN